MIDVNGRRYRSPRQPTVVVCVDGCEPDYIAQAVAGGHMPWLKRVLAERHGAASPTAWCPSFTNPNNLSIVTGAPPSVHGICGNYLFDVASGTEVMMNDPKWLRAPTHPGRARRRRPVGRRGHRQGQAAQAPRPRHEGHLLLGREGRRGDAGRERHRRRASSWSACRCPAVYSAELSEFVFAAGVQADAQTRRPDVMYLSTTDYVQHKHAPGHRRRQRVLRA